MHALWSGSISFGLVNIPVRLYPASKEREVSFHLLHKQDRSPIRFARVCKSDGREIPADDIVKGYEYKKDQWVILDDEDFDRANLKKSKSLEIFEFVDESHIDPKHFEKPYFIEPDGSAKPYAILREALEKTGKVGLAKYVLHKKEQLGIIRPSGDLLMLIQVRFEEELKQPAGINVPKKGKISEKELRMATQLIERQASKFHPGRYHDSYSRDVMRMIEKKAKGKRIRVTEPEPAATKTADLMTMLERSLRTPPKRAARPSQTKSQAR